MSRHPAIGFTTGFLSLPKAARWADVSEKTIKRWMKKGLPWHQAGPKEKVLIRPTDIEAFLTRQQAAVPNLNEMVDSLMLEIQQAGNET